MASYSKYICFLAALTLGILPSQTAPAIDTILLRPATWSEAVQPWKEYRESQGHKILELDSVHDAATNLAKLQETYQRHKDTLRYIVLAGDVDPRSPNSIGTHYRESKALVHFGGDKLIATDNPYADFDGDELPDVAIARIPADSRQELEKYFARVMKYETQESFDLWRRDIHVVAGVGGFGALADSVIEMTTRRFLADRVPGWSEMTMTQATTNSHYCPDPEKFSEVTTARMNQGGLFWVYIGHGHVRTLDYLRTKQGQLYPIFTENDLPAVRCKHSPIAVFLACYTGAFDATLDSLAERLILQDDGPIASIAASRVSGPYGLAMLADGMLDNFYVKQLPTLGEVVQLSKRRLLAPELEKAEAIKNPQIKMISAIASAMSPKDYDLRAERMEHVWQMHLLGDPMLRIRYPKTMELELPAKSKPGEELSIQGTCELKGKLSVELAYIREKVRSELSEIPTGSQTAEGRKGLQERYNRANDRILLTKSLDCSPGPFSLSLQIPADLANGKYCIRAFAKSEDNWQVGYQEISIRRPRNTSTSGQ